MIDKQFTEDDLLPLSALQHLVFCERQCALIHIEQVWIENRFTAEGRLLHEKADHGPSETRGDLRIVRALPLGSLKLGLSGRADVVEFHRVEAPGGGEIPQLDGRFQPVPIEYKRGKPKTHRADEVQLCAQALCLEEMYGVAIPSGALFYGKRQRRQNVAFDKSLRHLTTDAAERLHNLFHAGKTPLGVRERKCDRCSLFEICLPSAPSRSARAYLDQQIAKEIGRSE